MSLYSFITHNIHGRCCDSPAFISDIGNFSLFLFVSLARGVSILSIFSKNWLLGLLIFSVAILLSISFISILTAICLSIQET